MSGITRARQEARIDHQFRYALYAKNTRKIQIIGMY